MARMSEETFDHEENGFTFSDEDFGRRYSPEQSPPSPADLKNISRPANQKADSNIVRIHGGGNSFMRALRRRLAAAAARRPKKSNRAAQALCGRERTGPFPGPT
jgi:hypothetical protein